MTNHDAITIRLVLPFDECAALAQFVKRTTYDDVGQRTSTFVFYNGHRGLRAGDRLTVRQESADE